MPTSGTLFLSLLFAVAVLSVPPIVIQSGCTFPNGYSGITLSCPTGAFNVSATSLLQSYDMQTLNGAALKDMSGNGKDCTITGSPAQVAGLYGNAYKFIAASSQWMSCSTALATGATVTVFLILRITSASPPSMETVVSFNPTTTGNWFSGYFNNQCGGAPANNQIDMCSDGGGNYIANMSSTVFHYVVWTHNQAGNQQQVFIDGTLAPNLGSGGTANEVSETAFWLARYATGTNNFLDGSIDEFGLWNRILTSGEIQNLSVAGSGSFFPSVTTLPANVLTDIFSNAAQLNGNVVSTGTGAVFAWFAWGDTMSFGNNTTVQVIASPSAFSDVIRILFPNHLYYFRAHVENMTDATLSSDGATLSFTTGNGLDVTALLSLSAFVVIACTFSLFAYKMMRRRPKGGGMG